MRTAWMFMAAIVVATGVTVTVIQAHGQACALMLRNGVVVMLFTIASAEDIDQIVGDAPEQAHERRGIASARPQDRSAEDSLIALFVKRSVHQQVDG